MAHDTATCKNYDSGHCRSCSLFGIEPSRRLDYKLAPLLDLCRIHQIPEERLHSLWTPAKALTSRHKVKAAIGGTVEKPLVGFVDDSRVVRPLLDCPLLHPSLNFLLEKVSDAITEFKLTPYDIESRKGELKYVLAVLDPLGQHGIVRFVTRSTESHSRIRKALGKLQQQLPWLSVATTSVQPEAAALLEGPSDEFLTERTDILFPLDSFTLHVGPRSFVQVTPEAARALYAASREVARERQPKRVLDLYCGVGGFAFACAEHAEEVLGIEISKDAVTCATAGALTNSMPHCSFVCGDVATQAERILEFSAEMMIVNPPRAGLRAEVISMIGRSSPRTVLYSSCNPVTFFRDYEMIRDHYTISRVRPFDMFPCTSHLEVLIELEQH